MSGEVIGKGLFVDSLLTLESAFTVPDEAKKLVHRIVATPKKFNPTRNDLCLVGIFAMRSTPILYCSFERSSR